MNNPLSSILPPPPDLDAALAADAAALQQKQVATRRANAEPLPGPLAEAFGLETWIGDVRIRPVVAGDFVILKHLNSPLYQRTFALAEHYRAIIAREIPEDSVPPATVFQGDESAEMIYQFTQPLGTLRQLLRNGRTAFTTRAMRLVMEIEPTQIKPVFNACVESFAVAFNTAVKYESLDRESGETVVVAALDAGRADGLGWWLHYVAGLCHGFHWSRDYVLDELPLLQGFAFLAWLNEQDPESVAVGRRYIRQEMDRRQELEKLKTEAT